MITSKVLAISASLAPVLFYIGPELFCFTI